jgi:cellulose synthase/poly-beta-1,6-N-acetylglucosamine synthase-like glycosyltransferase
MTPPASLPDPLRILRERPQECARWLLTGPQALALAAAAGAVLAGLVTDARSTLTVLNAAAIVFYLAHILYKARLVYLSLERPAAVEVSAEEIAALNRSLLPTYTILVPLHREASVLADLVSSLAALDYPEDKYQVFLLLEEDDEETRAACAALSLPPNFRALIVPHSLPKTKPKACNWGLELAESDYLVIYDAEDRPEPDQLLKAAAAFRKLPRRVACLQAKLNYYNPRQNLLTRLFTAEYASWFDLFLPGLTAIGGPIPLGGTSNHFKTAVLKRLGGWDPFNVTEDCDLGVRLHKHGYRTAMINSTTWEEANCRLRSWIRQRSRWVKGYMQTYLVHMRAPLQLARALGFDGFVNFQMMIGGSIFCFLVNPVYWLMTLAWLVWHPAFIQSLFAPLWVYEMGVLCLFGGNFVFVYLSAAACANRQDWDLVKYCLLMPIYWVFMSLGAYKALGQLLLRPFHWEKTDHGFFTPQATG